MLWLLACACPTFDEIEVVDASSGLEPGVLGEIRSALEDFAVWTGREGVCATEIRAEDEIWVGDTQVDGAYSPRHRDIRVRRDTFPVRDVVTHELCHALDEDEGLAEANPDLFPVEETEKSELYSTAELRRAETFADACEVGAIYDKSLALALEERCGVDLLGDRGRFLAETVYPHGIFDGIAEEPADVTVTTLGAAPAGPWDRMVAAVPAEDKLALLISEYAPKSPRYERLSIVFVNPDTGAWRRVRPELRAGYWSAVAFPSDTRPYLLMRYDMNAPQAFWLDGDALVPAPIPPTDELPWNGAVQDGVVYYTATETIHTSPHLRVVRGVVKAMRLDDGAEVPLEFPRSAWDRSVIPYGMAPGPDSVELVAPEGFARLVDGQWELAGAPGNLLGLAYAGEHRVSLHYSAAGYVPVVERDGAWLLPDDPCGEDQVGTSYTPRLVQLGDRVIVVDPTPTNAGFLLQEVTVR